MPAFSWDVVKENMNDDYELLKTLFELSCSCHVWISCDTLQSYLYINDEELTLRHDSRLAGFFNDDLSSTQLVSLSKNLRNTSDLSRILSVIRKHIIEQSHIASTFKNDFAISQTHGHYIHGPKTMVHVLQKFDEKLLYDIFVKEFNELCLNDNMIDINDVGIVYTFVNYTNKQKVLKPIVDDILFSKNITPRQVLSTYSKEWPVVIALHTLVDDEAETLIGGSEKVSVDLEYLYITMSRARVKCTVIMFPKCGTILDNYHRMKRLLNKLDNLVEVKYH